MFAVVKPFIGNIVSLAALVGGFVGYHVSADQTTQLVSNIAILGGAIDSLWSIVKTIRASKAA
jgi:hypothetical protein